MKHHTLGLGLLVALLALTAGCANNDSPTPTPRPAQDMARGDMPGTTQDMPGTAADMPADMPGTAQDMPADMPGSDPDMSACPVAAPAEAGVARTAQGLVRGVRAGLTWTYKNIPFAAPPTGPNRWRPPQPPSCWAPAVRDASAFGARCPQLELNGSAVGDEDCLTLNVWVPDGEAPASGRPVMVYIHGGGNIAGSARQEITGTDVSLFDGQALAEQHGVVVVSVQYRLGALGFLALPQLRAEDADGHVGNYGLLDQIASLRWVKQNIASFQGDRARVMVFGESAGAVNTCALIASPLAAGLFHSALMQSGACVASPREATEAAATSLLSNTSCDAAPDVPACLRQLTASEVISTLPGTLNIGGYGGGADALAYGPIVDGWVLPRAPLAQIDAGEHNQVPVIVGSNSDEMASEAIFRLKADTPEQYEQVVTASILGLGLSVADAQRVLAQYPVASYDTPQDALIQVFTDATFTCSARTAARKLSAYPPPVRRYFFSRRPTTFRESLPASHGLELLYVFNTLTQIPLYRPVPEDLTLSAQMMRMWSNLATSGDPNDSTLSPSWPAYTTSAEVTHVLDAPLSNQDNLRGDACDLWDNLLTRAAQ